MNSYLYKILNENEDVEYTQEQYNKSQRDLRKAKLILKHIRPNKSLCCFHIVAFPAYNEVKIFPVFTALYTPHSEFQRIKKKIDSKEKDWEILKATGNGKGYKAELIDEFGNIIRVFKFDANGNFQFELLDFVYTSLTLLEEVDRSKLNVSKVESSINTSISTKKYFFPVNESSLNEIQKIDLRNWLRDQTNSTFTVSGFASSDGSSKRNKELANTRIQATKQWLIANGIPEKNIKIKIVGINETGEKGRRVELEAIPLSSQ